MGGLIHENRYPQLKPSVSNTSYLSYSQTMYIITYLNRILFRKSNCVEICPDIVIWTIMSGTEKIKSAEVPKAVATRVNCMLL